MFIYPLLSYFCADFYYIRTAARPLIMDSVLDAIGDTPLIRCSRLMASEGVECEILAKCEFFNAGGSVKVFAVCIG